MGMQFKLSFLYFILKKNCQSCDTLTEELNWSVFLNYFQTMIQNLVWTANLNYLPQEYLQKEHPGLRQIIERCGGRYHVINNRQRQNREQVCELFEKVRSWCGEQLTEKFQEQCLHTHFATCPQLFCFHSDYDGYLTISSVLVSTWKEVQWILDFCQALFLNFQKVKCCLMAYCMC